MAPWQLGVNDPTTCAATQGGTTGGWQRTPLPVAVELAAATPG